MVKAFNLVIAIVIISLEFNYAVQAQESPSPEYMENYKQIMERTQWMRDARFGMFIHFGAYAVPARGEWIKANEKLTTETYQKYIDAFNPVDFDAKKWAKVAREAGMKYAVLTTKHHDGYCLFNTKLTDYKLEKKIGGRDLVREYIEAFRAEGLKVGLYYSIIDWHHPDYPNVFNHPQRDDKEYGKRKFNWDNYLKYMHGQVEELVTNYGKLDIFWFDNSFDDYSGEKWKAEELVKMVRKHQPDIILNRRLETQIHGSTDHLMLNSLGDFQTPEQDIPDFPLVDIYKNPIPWESCMTLNNNWGFAAADEAWKSPELIIHSLVNCVSKNGNLLLNVGPDPRGNIPEQSLRILNEVGKWMEKNGESIYGCGVAPLARPEWGRYTAKGNNLYVHWLYPICGNLNTKGVNADDVQLVTLLSTGAELSWQTTWWGNMNPGNFFIKATEKSDKPVQYDTVVKITSK